MSKTKLLTFITAVVMTSTVLVNAAPEVNKDVPSELNADEVEYDMNTGVVTATGNVILKHDNGVATGLKAMYNVNTEEAYLYGNVIVVRDNLRLTCDKLVSDGSGYMQADGNVHAEQKVEPTPDKPEGDFRTFTGEHVDYYPDDRKHVVIPTGGIATSNDGTFTADHMEGWIDDEYYVGTGNAHLVSPPRNLEAGGDRVDYYAQENGKAILTGNAWAFQDNNTLKGNRLTVYLADDKKLKAKEEPQNPFDKDKRKTKKPVTDEMSTDNPFVEPVKKNTDDLSQDQKDSSI